MATVRARVTQEGAKSNMVITCKEHGEIQLTMEQHTIFTSTGEAGGRCPVCRHIPKQIRRLFTPSPENE